MQLRMQLYSYMWDRAVADDYTSFNLESPYSWAAMLAVALSMQAVHKI
jgi:hypothetical protein